MLLRASWFMANVEISLIPPPVRNVIVVGFGSERCHCGFRRFVDLSGRIHQHRTTHTKERGIL